jgi:hypothetical protein
VRNTAESNMADVTYFVAIPFAVGDDGPEPREAVECTSANAAIMRAESNKRWFCQRQKPKRRDVVESALAGLPKRFLR